MNTSTPQQSQEGERRYKSPLRDEQARRTRVAILEAAQSLFVEHGYAGTSIRAIARAARVSESTVYNAFADKASILWAIVQHVVYGPENTQIESASIIDAVRNEPEPEGRLRIIARWSCELYERGVADIERVITEAAPSDPRIRELAERASTERYQATRMLVALVAETLPSAKEIDRVAQIIWAVDSSPVYLMLVGEQRWTPKQFEDWIFEFYRSQLPT